MTDAPGVGMYVRISEDVGLTGLGVARQRQDCEALIERKGWKLTTVYEDNDVSATSGRKRPEYERMLADAKAGKLTGIVVWDVDRLTRTPSELELFIDIANAHDLALASVGGEIDLATPQGRLTARIKGAVARHEVEQSSRRLKRKNLERAQAGLSHGTTAFGWRRERTPEGIIEHVVPEQARLVVEACDRLIAGDKLSTIAGSWNKAGHRTATGKEWHRSTVRSILERHRNAGLRVYQGKVIGTGAWEPLISVETFERVQAILNDPSRYVKPGRSVTTLLSGLAKCGICGATMISSLRRGRNGDKDIRALMCKGCGGTMRKEVDVQAMVETALLRRLNESDPHELFARKGSDPELARREVESLRQRKRDAATMFASGDIDGGQLREINERLAEPLAAAEAAYADALAEPDLIDLAGEGILARWDDLGLDRKRRVLDYVISVTVHPTKHLGYYRRFFDASTIELTWKV